MSIPYRARKLFYQNGHLSVELGGATIGSIFRNNGVPLAQRLRDEGSDKTAPMPGDQKNSVLGLLGSSRTDVAYTPYGYAPFTKEECLLLGFNGQHRSFGPDLYFLGNGYRIYSSILNRFYSSDTWSPFGDGGLNAYAYCVGDPVNWADPSGHMRRSPVAHTPVLHRGRQPSRQPLQRLNSRGSSVESRSSSADSPSRSHSPVAVSRRADSIGAWGNGRDDLSALFTIEGSSNPSSTSNTITSRPVNEVGVPLDFTISEGDPVGQAVLRRVGDNTTLPVDQEVYLRVTQPRTTHGMNSFHLLLGRQYPRLSPPFLNVARLNYLKRTT